YTLEQVAVLVIKRMNVFLVDKEDLLKDVTKVMIELQPKVNNKMKFTSHVLFSKFVEYFMGFPGSVPVVFERATRKLKVYKGPEIKCELKTPYSRRKFMAVEHTRWFLKSGNKEYITFFESNKKKDDLSDSFLMCLNGCARMYKVLRL
ncbi:hypothetical protein SAGO17_0090, partial [Mimivirus AB-566-O17]